MRDKSIANLAALAAMMGLAGVPEFPLARLRRRQQGRWFGVPKEHSLTLPSVDKSQHATLRHGQTERRRKHLAKTNRQTHKRYRRAQS